MQSFWQGFEKAASIASTVAGFGRRAAGFGGKLMQNPGVVQSTLGKGINVAGRFVARHPVGTAVGAGAAAGFAAGRMSKKQQPGGYY